MGALQIVLAMDPMNESEREDPIDSAVEFGRSVHGHLDNWTGKVDNKASIVLAIESAAFAFVVTQTDQGKQFADLGHLGEWWFRIGLGLLLLAMVFALLVVWPQLNGRKSKRDWKSNTIYFGHLRHWEPSDLAAALLEWKTEPDQLARQMVAMSKIAWRKHVWLQISLGAFSIGAALLIVSSRDSSSTTASGRSSGEPVHDAAEPLQNFKGWAYLARRR